MAKVTLTPETVVVIEKILNNGCCAEVKIEHNDISVIEIRRKKKN